MGDLTVKQDGSGDYTTLKAALADAGLAPGDTITIAGFWTIAEANVATTVADENITVTADADARHYGVVTHIGGTGGSPTSPGHYRLENTAFSGDIYVCASNHTCENIVMRPRHASASSVKGVSLPAASGKTITFRNWIIYTDGGNVVDAVQTSNLVNSTVNFENCILMGFPDAGILVQGSISLQNTNYNIDSCAIFRNGTTPAAQAGIHATPAGTATPEVTFNIKNSIIAGHTVGGDLFMNVDSRCQVNINNSVSSDVTFTTYGDSVVASLENHSITDSATPGAGDWIVVTQNATRPYNVTPQDIPENAILKTGATALTTDIAGNARPASNVDIGPFQISVGPPPGGGGGGGGPGIPIGFTSDFVRPFPASFN